MRLSVCMGHDLGNQLILNRATRGQRQLVHQKAQGITSSVNTRGQMVHALCSDFELIERHLVVLEGVRQTVVPGIWLRTRSDDVVTDI